MQPPDWRIFQIARLAWRQIAASCYTDTAVNEELGGRRLGRTLEEDPNSEQRSFKSHPLKSGHLETIGPVWAEPMQAWLGTQTGEAEPSPVEPSIDSDFKHRMSEVVA